MRPLIAPKVEIPAVQKTFKVLRLNKWVTFLFKHYREEIGWGFDESGMTFGNEVTPPWQQEITNAILFVRASCGSVPLADPAISSLAFVRFLDAKENPYLRYSEKYFNETSRGSHSQGDKSSQKNGSSTGATETECKMGVGAKGARAADTRNQNDPESQSQYSSVPNLFRPTRPLEGPAVAGLSFVRFLQEEGNPYLRYSEKDSKKIRNESDRGSQEDKSGDGGKDASAREKPSMKNEVKTNVAADTGTQNDPWPQSQYSSVPSGDGEVSGAHIDEKESDLKADGDRVPSGSSSAKRKDTQASPSGGGYTHDGLGIKRRRLDRTENLKGGIFWYCYCYCYYY